MISSEEDRPPLTARAPLTPSRTNLHLHLIPIHRLPRYPEVRMRCRALGSAGFAFILATPAAAQQASRPYTEGSVVEVQYIRVKPGRFDEYMAYLAGPYKQTMEAQKKAGVITGWAVYASDNRDEEDWNLALTTTYKNMAALDNLRDRVDPIQSQVFGSMEKSSAAMVKRGEMREVVGGRQLRELIIK